METVMNNRADLLIQFLNFTPRVFMGKVVLYVKAFCNKNVLQDAFNCDSNHEN